jgi:subtilisin family serine protease
LSRFAFKVRLSASEGIDMGRHLSIVTCLIVLGGLVTPSAGALPPVATNGVSPADPGPIPEQVPGQVIVSYRASTEASDRAVIRADVGATSATPMGLARTEVLEVGRGQVDETIEALASSPDVAYVEPNFYYRAASLSPNDPRFTEEWALNNTGQSLAGVAGTTDADIDAPEAWSTTTGSSAVTVAVIDTGVAYDHPDLAANIWTNPGETGSGRESNNVDDDGNGVKDDWRGWDFVDADNRPRDLLGHGTHVAGIIGAVGNNGAGTSGVAWNVRIMPLRVLGADGVGTTANVASAVAYAVNKGADIINLSLSGSDLSLSVANAIAAATDSLVVVAAGNEGRNNDVTASYPCNYATANIVCVAATDQDDKLAGYSNFGAANVDLAAPGSRVVSTVPAFTRPLQETFNSDISATWTTGGPGIQWARGSDALGSFAADSPGTDYESNTNSWLQTASPVSLVDQQSCRVMYSYSLETEERNDVFEVEASTDGTKWTHVGGWTGSTNGDWLSANHDLSRFDGASVYLRFRMVSNALLNFDGISIRQVEVRCLGSSYTGNEFSSQSGTSMAVPHVSGVAALVVSVLPDATVATLKNALLAGVDPLTVLLGTTTTGGRLNAAAALSVATTGALPLPTTSPSATASPTASPSASTSVSPSPSPSVSPPVDTDHPRQIGFFLRGHLRVQGGVFSTDGFLPCIAGVQVNIKRNGKVVKKVTTDADGNFSIRVRDRVGRYRVKAPAVDVTLGRCLSTVSPVRRHHHR